MLSFKDMNKQESEVKMYTCYATWNDEKDEHQFTYMSTISSVAPVAGYKPISTLMDLVSEIAQYCHDFEVDPGTMEFNIKKDGVPIEIPDDFIFAIQECIDEIKQNEKDEEKNVEGLRSYLK